MNNKKPMYVVTKKLKNGGSITFKTRYPLAIEKWNRDIENKKNN